MSTRTLQNLIEMDSVLYYNTIKDSYENLYSREQSSKIRFLLSRIDIKESDKILDVGAGTGILESILAKNKIVAIEPSDMADMMDAKRLKNVLIERRRIQDFDTEEKFDVIFCITVLQDIKEGREEIIKKLFSLARAGGHVIISVLRASNMDLKHMGPVESGFIENDRYFIFIV